MLGTFSECKSLALEVRYRCYFMESGCARPYVAGRLGATQTNGIRATFVIPDASIAIDDVPFTEENGAAVQAWIPV